MLFPSPEVIVRNKNEENIFVPIEDLSCNNWKLSFAPDCFEEYVANHIPTGRKIQAIPIKNFLQQKFKIYMHPMKPEDQFEFTGQWSGVLKNIANQKK